MLGAHASYAIDDDPARRAFAQIQAWLIASHWSLGITRAQGGRAAQYSSRTVGAYREGRQAGYLRVISDRTAFAYVCDVFVDSSHCARSI